MQLSNFFFSAGKLERLEFPISVNFLDFFFLKQKIMFSPFSTKQKHNPQTYLIDSLNLPSLHNKKKEGGKVRERGRKRMTLELNDSSW